MAFSNVFNYLKSGNSSASGNLNKPDKDALHKVGGNPKESKKVGQNKEKMDLGMWQIVDDDDDDVKVPIKKKSQEIKPESSLSSILVVDSDQTDEDSDGFYVIDDLVVNTQNDSLLKKVENFEKHTYSIIRAKGNKVKVIQSNDPTEWENSDNSDESDDSFEIVNKVDDKQLSSMIANCETLTINNVQHSLHLQSFYEPDKPKKPLSRPHHYGSDSSGSSSRSNRRLLG